MVLSANYVQSTDSGELTTRHEETHRSQVKVGLIKNKFVARPNWIAITTQRRRVGIKR